MCANQRQYDRDFKLNAVKLFVESNTTRVAIAERLGIPAKTFDAWVREFAKNSDNSFLGKGKIKSCNEEMFRLKKELADIREERDILKKALAIFSQKK
jgi:transposase-like protein